MKVYKIKNLKTGLYSTGGLAPRWKKKGKTWTAKQYVQSHIDLVCSHHNYYHRQSPYISDCVIEEYITILNQSTLIVQNFD